MTIESFIFKRKESSPTEANESVFDKEILNQETIKALQDDVCSVSASEVENHKISWQEKLKDSELNDMVEAVFALPAVLRTEQSLEKIRDTLEKGNNLNADTKNILRNEQVAALKDLSEALGAFSHYLMMNDKSIEELQMFWKIYENYSREKNAYSLFNEIRSGILGQVATEHLIQSLGLNCSAANWEEDVFEGTDLIISNKGRAPDVGRLQVKYKHVFNRLEIIDVKEYNPTFSVEASLGATDKNLTHFIPDTSFDNLKHNCSPDELAYYIRIPDKNPDGSPTVDHITGIPSDALIQDFQNESRKVFKDNFITTE